LAERGDRGNMSEKEEEEEEEEAKFKESCFEAIAEGTRETQPQALKPDA